jgi:hypothetical protein
MNGACSPFSKAGWATTTEAHTEWWEPEAWPLAWIDDDRLQTALEFHYPCLHARVAERQTRRT